jgi:hypothetical protein
VSATSRRGGGRENDNEKTTLEHPIPVRGTATGHWHCGGKYRYTNTYTGCVQFVHSTVSLRDALNLNELEFKTE